MERKPKITDINCPKPKCAGALFLMESLSRIEQAMNVRRVQCDKCRAAWVFNCEGV